MESHRFGILRLPSTISIRRRNNHANFTAPFETYRLPDTGPKTDRPVLAAVTGNKKTLLIDAGNSVGHAQLFQDELLKHDISGDLLVLTHSHWDHVFGLEHIRIPVICHEKTYQHIKEMQPLSWEDQALDERVEEGTEIPFCADAIKLELGRNREISMPLPDIRFEKS